MAQRGYYITLCYDRYMRNGDSVKTYGLIGAILIITAYVLWAFVLPALSKQPDQKTIDTVTQEPLQKQENPTNPTGESAMPSKP